MTRTLYKKNFTFQRRSESPLLSMAALLGSVVLHAVAFCSIRLGAVDSVNTVEKEPVSVELIELPPIVESRKPVSGTVINSKILPPIANKPITSKGTIPDGEVIAKSQNKVAAKPVNARSPQPKPATKPTVAAKPAARSPNPKPLPKPVVAAKPAARSPQPKPATKPTVAAKPAARSPQPKPAPKPTVAAKPAARSPQPKPAPKPTVAAKPAARSPNPKPLPKPVVAAKPAARSPQPKPATKPTVAAKPATRSPQPKPAPKPTVAAKPAARSPQPKPAPKPTVAAKPAARSPQPKPTVTPKPVVVRAGSVRAMPYPPASLGDRKPVTPRPPLIASPKPQPSGSQNNGSLIATFDLGSIRSGERDIPDQLAKPLQNQRQFSPILDPLQFGLRSGSTLTFEVLIEIDEKGKLTIIRQVNPVEDSTQRQSGVQSTDYLGFAKELLKNWQFQAAHSGGQAVYSELWLRLTVKAL